jgi:maltose/maltodextrin transport system permease protein
MSADTKKSPEEFDMRNFKPRKSVLGLTVKYIILGLITAIGVYAIYLMLINQMYWQPALLAISLIGINFLYMTERAVPLKYLLPGTITMAVFGVLPIVYSIYIAFTNYSTGHEVSKPEAIEAITRDGYFDYDSFTVQVADGPEGRVYLLQRYDAETSEDEGSFIGTPEGITPAPEPFVLNENNVFEPIAPDGYTPIDDNTIDKWIGDGKAFVVPLDKGNVVLDSSHTGFQRAYRWEYDPATGSLTDVSCGNVFKDNGYGSFEGVECESGETIKLPTGWMVQVGFDNFRKIFGEHRYSEALWRVFLWTIVYAFSSVFLTFACGLGVALLFNVNRMRGRKLYRGLLIIPYAVPGFLSLLVWRGLLNDTMGVANPVVTVVKSFLYNNFNAMPVVVSVAIVAIMAATGEFIYRRNQEKTLRHITTSERIFTRVPFYLPAAFFMFVAYVGHSVDASDASIPWLTDPNWAKISILLVNTWLGFPYMFLIGTGALQAIPAELKEAAAVDGASRFQIFRNVTMPLLLVAVGPLLVGSFSFNFNNFNQIYLLTGGGPALQNNDSAAGATDILISYTYKLSFASGQGNNYGLSAAVSILLFFIVGGMAFWSFRRSKALENMS